MPSQLPKITGCAGITFSQRFNDIHILFHNVIKNKLELNCPVNTRNYKKYKAGHNNQMIQNNCTKSRNAVFTLNKEKSPINENGWEPLS